MQKVQKVIIILIASCLAMPSAFGQNLQFSEKEEEFGNSVQKILANNIGVQFQELWQQQNFTAEQKAQVMAVTKKMVEKKFQVRPQILNFFSAVNAGVRVQNMQGADLSAFLETTQKVLEKYARNDISKYLSNSKLFLEENVLFKSNAYTLQTRRGNYKFKFIDENAELEDQEALFDEEEAEEETSTINWDEVGKSVSELAGEEEADTPIEDFSLGDMQIILPPIQGAVIEFEGIDLAFANRGDTTLLSETSGSIVIESGLWVGEKGKMDWSGTKVLGSDVYAELDKYTFDVTRSKLSAENVTFHYPEKLSEPVKGVMEYSGDRGKNKTTSYPRFKSYQSNIVISNLGKGEVSYKGGIALRGSNLYSSSAYDELAILEGFKDGERRFKAISGLFNFQESDSIITASVAAVIIYQGNDSIYHPAVSFEYELDNSFLRLKAAKGGFKNTPYNSSYFNMDISADMLEWDIMKDSLDISVVTARGEKPVVIESRDYFRRDRFESLSGLHNFHPLLILINYSRKSGMAEFSMLDILDETKIQEDLLRKTMFDLMQSGLIDFNGTTGDIKITRKGFHYYLSQVYKKDYDDMIIPSIIGTAPNATLYVKDNVLKMRGVERFYVSDSLDVIITPANQEVSILKNRKIVFDGSMNAGNFQFIGQQITFDYDSFLVDLPKIDSIKLLVENENGNKQRLDNQLVDTSGRLLINKANNKSGLRSFPQFPIFNSHKRAVVYFDKPTVLGGAYDSTVFFDVPPFELDSAADADPSTLAFEGTFTSGGVFPDFKDRLLANDDNSLGFTHRVPEEGYSLYGTSAKIYDNITLNSDGLTSTGQIDFLTSSFEVESSTFYLDSLYAKQGKTGEMRPGSLGEASFPSVLFKDYEMNWQVKKDSMKLKTLSDPFQVYDSIADFSGTMVITSAGLLGGGQFDMNGTMTISEKLSFAETKFAARNALFEIGPENPRETIMSGDDVKLDYDLEAQIAEIQPEQAGVAALEFPFAQVKTSIPNATWDIQEKVIRMNKPDTVDISQSFFYTTNEALDSLAFNATGATYDIDKLELKVEGIPYITVADARITTEDNEVLILENSKISTLTNAVVVIDTANAYHRLYDATINIVSRNEFNGEGTYELINTVQDTFAIKFNAFETVEDEEHGRYTKSSGRVLATNNIVPSPGFTFKGDVHMYAYRKALELDGAVKLNLAKLKEKNVWIEYASNDDIQEVIIDFDNAKTEGGDQLTAGLHFNQGDIYLSFITEKRGFDDEDLFVPRGGHLSYDADTSAFKIQNPEKLNGSSYAGSMFSYNEDTQNVGFEGKMNFVGANNKGIKVEGSGIGFGNLDSATFEIDALMTIDYELPAETFPLMAADLKLMGEKLAVKKAHDDRSDLIYKLAEIIGDEATRNWDNLNLNSYSPLINTSELLLKDLVITKANMKWSKQNKAFYSEGKIGLSNVGSVDLNMEVDGFIEMRKTPEGDFINVLLQMTDGTWYYFGHDGQSMATFSSNPAFNNVILTKSNVGKAKIGAFTYFAATIEEVMVWASNYQKLYYGLDEPYRLLMANESSQTLKKKTTEEGDGF